jgi:3',5'-cyclic AMP phosphodiesterase CpdA
VRTIAHISDLHFGTEDPVVAAALLAELDGRAGPAPSVVAVSGDLTQRARRREFRAARAFLDRVPGPVIVVPGNHDVPLYHLFARLLHPTARYRAAITEDLAPLHADDEIAVAGINTAHGLTVKDGRVTRAMAEAVRARLAPLPARWKVVVAHHPFALPAGAPESDRVDGAADALAILEDAGVQLVLSGHLHVAYSSDPTAFRSDDHAVVNANAGTCMSRRLRGEPNAYNWITLDGEQIDIVNRVWDGARFVGAAAKVYHRVAGRTTIARGPEAA